MNKIYTYIKNGLHTLALRWKAMSPKFWINVQNTAITLGSAALGVIMADKLFGLQSYGVSSVVFTVCGYILAICGGMGLTAKLTVKDGFKTDNNG